MPSSLPCTPARRRLAARCAHKASKSGSRIRRDSAPFEGHAGMHFYILSASSGESRETELMDVCERYHQICTRARHRVVITKKCARQFPPPRHGTAKRSSQIALERAMIPFADVALNACHNVVGNRAVSNNWNLVKRHRCLLGTTLSFAFAEALVAATRIRVGASPACQGQCVGGWL